jgi:oxygen-dependent protoporphyrinogen oxidase
VTKKNIIIGAGIAGLTAAFELKKSGQDFLVLEKSCSAGGNWHSYSYKNSLYEFGPNSFMSNAPEFLEMIQEAGFGSELISKSFKDSMRYLYLDSKLIPVKPGPALLFSGILRLGDWLRALGEYFVPPGSSSQVEETVHDFFTRRFGSPVADRVIANALQGVWAGDTRQLSMKSAMPKLFKKEQEFGSVFRSMFNSPRTGSGKPLESFSFRKGMQSFCEHMVDYLGRDKFVFSANISSVSSDEIGWRIDLASGQSFQSKNLIFATKAFQAGDLLKSSLPKLSCELNKIYYAPVSLFAYSIKKSLLKPSAKKTMDAFGFISGDREHLTLGSIWSSQLFPERNLEDEYLMISFMGGSKNPQVLDYDEDSLWERLISEQIQVLQPYAVGQLGLGDFTKINFMNVPQAIPQYHLGHGELLERVQALVAQTSNLYLLGNYIDGVSIADTIRLSKKVMGGLVNAPQSCYD